MNPAQKRAHWTSVIEQQKQSQLSIKQFCEDNGINYQTFFPGLSDCAPLRQCRRCSH